MAKESRPVFAGGDLPEIRFLLPGVTRPIIFEALDNEVFYVLTDLTDLVESSGLAGYPNVAQYPDYLWDATGHNGRIRGIAKPVLRNNDPTFLRADWQQALGMEDLTDAEAVKALLVAMSVDDPDGNGTQDTWVFAPHGGNWNNLIINQMFRVPCGWHLTGDGTLTAAHETDEYRQALLFAKELFDAGAYHPDAASLNTGQATALLVGARSAWRPTGSLLSLAPLDTAPRSRRSCRTPIGSRSSCPVWMVAKA